MDKKVLENRLRADAGRMQAACPPHLRHRVAARVREQQRHRSSGRFGLPALVSAFGTLVVLVAVWMLWQPGASQRPTVETAGLNAEPVVASSDRLLASQEAALETEWQLLERDLRHLRDHVAASLERKPNG